MPQRPLNIAIIGAGPAGLYLAILLRRSGADHRIRIFEQNARDSTFGFGVAFSQRALSVLRGRDEESRRRETLIGVPRPRRDGRG